MTEDFRQGENTDENQEDDANGNDVVWENESLFRLYGGGWLAGRGCFWRGWLVARSLEFGGGHGRYGRERHGQR